MSKKIVVTGATGFVGSHILENFITKKDVLASCRDKSKLPLAYQDRALIADLHDANYVDNLTKEARVICHTASWAEMNGKLEDSQREFLVPTFRLIDLAVQNGLERFIFLSAITSKPIEEGRVHSELLLADIWSHYDSIMKIEKYLEALSSKMEVIILRVGYFTGKNYALGLLPILLPRLKTHLVPYIKGGSTTLPLIDGADIALAFNLATTVELNEKLTVMDIVGKETPTVKEVFTYLHEKYNYPLPHFSVPFGFAYLFARFMRFIHKVIPYDPLIVPAVVLLLEETHANNEKAEKLLGYNPKIDWKESIDIQIAEMNERQTTNMRMNK